MTASRQDGRSRTRKRWALRDDRRVLMGMVQVRVVCDRGHDELTVLLGVKDPTETNPRWTLWVAGGPVRCPRCGLEVRRPDVWWRQLVADAAAAGSARVSLYRAACVEG